MAAKTKKKPARPAAAPPPSPDDGYGPPKPPATTPERLAGIRTMRDRIYEHVSFMCGVAALPGSSSEEKEKAVAVFYEQMVQLERRLARIAEDLRLG